MKRGLTPRQLDLLEFLRTYVPREGHAPTFLQMMTAVGLKSKSGVSRLVESLEERGYISRLPNRSRTIVLVEDADRFAESVESSIAAYCQRNRIDRNAAIAQAVECFFGSAA